MKRRRVLVLLSVNDEVTISRVGFLIRSPKLQDIDLKFCYALQVEEYERTLSYAVSYDALLLNLETEVNSFKPEALVFHTGAAFNSKPDSFLQALAVIKDRHPDIEIRYERLPAPPGDFMSSEYRMIPLAQLLTDNKLFSGEDTEVLTWR